MIQIAFSGKMRAGKDTAADYIIKKLGEDGFYVERMAFADTLKGIRGHFQEDCGFEVVKDRELEIMIGQYARKLDPLVWVNATEREIKAEVLTDCFKIVTDMRFPNEFNMLERNKFILVRIEAEPEVRLARGADPEFMNNDSETALDEYAASGQKFQFVINNNRGLDELYVKLDRLLDFAWKMTGK